MCGTNASPCAAGQSLRVVAALTHHLALLQLRSAQALEEKEEPATAEPHWQRSWSAWLRFLAAPSDQGGTAIPDAARLASDRTLAAGRPHRRQDRRPLGPQRRRCGASALDTGERTTRAGVRQPAASPMSWATT